MAWIVVLLLVPLLAALGEESARYVVAARARAARDDACPFENDDDARRPIARDARDALVETLLLLWCFASAALPCPRGSAGAGPVVVLLAERGLPRRSLRTLARRLARTLGAATQLEQRRHAWITNEARTRRLVDHLAALRVAEPARPVVLVGHGAGGVVAHHAASELHAADVHVVTLGAAHGVPATVPPHATLASVASIYSVHDAWIVPPDRAYLTGAFNVVLRDVGHFGLVAGGRAWTVVREHLEATLPRGEMPARRVS